MLRGYRRVARGVPLATAATSTTVVSPLQEQRRYSLKYARKPHTEEMRQPSYIHDKRYGIFDNERNIGKPRYGLPHITPLYTKHMNLWETDTDASTNRFFRPYVLGQRELHLLLGRPHGFEANEAGGRQGDSAYELSTDMRYKGIARPAITNLHYEPEWCYTLYRHGAHGSQLSNPRSPLTEEILGPELLAIRDIKSLEHCRAWFDRLRYLIQLHYDAVGDIGPFRSRHTQHVHEFFVCFHDALSSFDFQDRYLVEQFAQARPAELDDLFAIFLEMEGNYLNEDYCPRCSLPYATTRFCGEGDTTTPFRKHRGRWARHQQWGKEWYDVVTRRAEALWYRATEDPYFGTPHHTQRQVAALLHVYVKAKQRAKAIDFVHALRGSSEFLQGTVRITNEMQAALDALLDQTPHQHLLTNSYVLESRAAQYTGEARKVPLSPLQLRLDLELAKVRREQREEGVVRVPPAGWQIDTKAIVPYELDRKTRRVTNWRAVKEGIERSFMNPGLPKEAYTSQEWREMLYLRAHLAARAERRAALEATRRQDEARAARGSHVVFPDRHWYRVFDTSAEALRQRFDVGPSGTLFAARMKVFADPAAVAYTDPITKTTYTLNTTPEACGLYGGYESGDVLRVRRTPSEADQSNAHNETTTKTTTTGEAKDEVVVVGVNVSGTETDWALIAMYADPTLHARHGLFALGRDYDEIAASYAPEVLHDRSHVVPFTLLDGLRTVQEEMLGQIVGLRHNVLYVQWRLLKGGGAAMDRSVAVPLGVAAVVRARVVFTEPTRGLEPLQPPPSWRVPFLNTFADERLKELTRAPFTRERWASLIEGKYTPKKKPFGYTQHTTQDDFATKQYADRLLSRQFFTNPQAFAILPERRARAVRFGGKWLEGQRVCGLPTVDRNELEKGWADAEPISDAEMQTIEQALRDISGTRPGNYRKTDRETQTLQLNESWWRPLHFGWQAHNRAQRAFLDTTEQHLIEPSKLPFHGASPPFGTSYGIGERIRAIAEDYGKGFGLGPDGHSPSYDRHDPVVQLRGEEALVQTLGLGNALVRLFDAKLGEQDVHAWALEQSTAQDVNVRDLLLDVHEWREKGRPPSLLLCRVLDRYLKEEIARFNEGIPANVPRLELTTRYDHNSSGGDRHREGGVAGPPGSVWYDVDAEAYAFDYQKHRERGDADEAYILGLVQRAQLAGGTHFVDANLNSHLQSHILADFQVEVARLVGRGLSANFLAQRSSQLHRGAVRLGGNVATYVRVSELAALLARRGVTAEDIAVVTRGLANCPEQEPIGDGDFAVPVSLLYSWTGPGSTQGGGARATSAAAAGRLGSHHALTQTLRAAQGGSSGRAGRESKMLVQVLQELALRHDGWAADVLYTIRENRRNAVLRQEFFAAFLPVFGNDTAHVGKLYADYCEGKYVPNITVAIEAFILFLANVATNAITQQAVVPYFDTVKKEEGGDAEQTAAPRYTQLKLLPPTVGPFTYENTRVEAIETAELFERYGIGAGPTRVPGTGFIAAESKSLSYFTHRNDEVVYVTARQDQGLQQALSKSVHYKVIAGHPALRALLSLSQPSSSAHAALVACFNRFFYRVAPMLSFYQGVLQSYVARDGATRHVTEHTNRSLARILESELSTTVEQNFRRNAERYWRGVLEGRNIEEAALVSPPAPYVDHGGAHTNTTREEGGSSSSSGGSTSSSSTTTSNAGAAGSRRSEAGMSRPAASAARSVSRSMDDLLSRLNTAAHTQGKAGSGGNSTRNSSSSSKGGRGGSGRPLRSASSGQQQQQQRPRSSGGGSSSSTNNPRRPK